MAVSRGTFAFAAFAVAVSLGCMRLGFWQLARLHERRERNDRIIGRLSEPAVPFERVPLAGGARFRRATASGRYDFANEFVLTSRSRNGAPGVHIITPLLTGHGDTAVLVNRGWAYSPDGMHIDLALFREDTNAAVDGFVDDYAVATEAISTPNIPGAVRRLDRDSLAARLPYPLAPVVLVQRMDSGEFAAVDRGTPVRVEPPPLDEGPHRAYAVQWFSFVVVGIVGTILVIQRDRTKVQGTNSG